MEFQYWLRMAKKELSTSNSPKCDAEILLAHVTGKNRAFILSFGETKLIPDELRRLNELLSRRKLGEPIAYLTGEREFWSLPLYVSSSTLIPRPDTEFLVEQALLRLPIGVCRILDLGTGTGAIALAIASERPDCEVIAVDLLPDIVELAQRNVSRLGLTNVTVRQSCWFSALDNNDIFTLIVSNPPYLDEQDSHLTQGDVRFEQRSALVADKSGFADLAHIIVHAKQYLITNGWLLVEHGWKQGEMVRKMFSQENYHSIETYHDYGGNERITLGRVP